MRQPLLQLLDLTASRKPTHRQVLIQIETESSFALSRLLLNGPEALTMADTEVCSQAPPSRHAHDCRLACILCHVRRCATQPSRKSWTPKLSCRALGSSGLHVGRLGELLSSKLAVRKATKGTVGRLVSQIFCIASRWSALMNLNCQGA